MRPVLQVTCAASERAMRIEGSYDNYILLGVRIRSVCLARAHLTFKPTRDITFSRRGMLIVGHVQEQCEQCGQCELL